MNAPGGEETRLTLSSTWYLAPGYWKQKRQNNQGDRPRNVQRRKSGSG